MNIERLVEMANDIGHFFEAEPDHALAVAGIENHLRKFWEPRMRRQIIAHAEAGGTGLEAPVLEAIRRLAADAAAA